MAYYYWSNPLTFRFDSLPLVLAGPNLRRVTPNSVTVWIAFRGIHQIPVLKVYHVSNTINHIFSSDSYEASGAQAFVTHWDPLFNIAILEAKCIDILSSQPLSVDPADTYCYDIIFPKDCEGVDFSQETGGFGTSGVVGYATTEEPYPARKITFCDQPLPSFCLPPLNLNLVRLIYGSCRKPHNVGLDAFEAYATMIEDGINGPSIRPHQLFLIGDQIYADDVADGLLAMIHDFNRKFFRVNLEQEFPDDDNMLPGHRGSLITGPASLNQCEFTSEKDVAKSHLLTLHEFYGMYMMNWSQELWPAYSEWPFYSNVETNISEDDYNNEIQELYNFYKALPNVRKVMANVPVYMLLDDHEITDDLFFSHEWTMNALNNAPAKKVILNGMVAYALFQDAGNDLNKYYNGVFFNSLVENSEANWVMLNAIATMENLVLPDYDSTNQIMISRTNGIKWNFSLNMGKYEVIALDTRMFRSFPKQATPELTVLPVVLPIGKKEYFDDQIPELTDPGVQLTILLIPDPVYAPEILISGKKLGVLFGLAKEYPYSALPNTYAQQLINDMEDWDFALPCQREFLDRLKFRTNDKQGRIMILTGDVHFGCTIRTQFWGNTRTTINNENTYIEDDYNLVIGQLCASSHKKADPDTFKGTYALHNQGYVPNSDPKAYFSLPDSRHVGDTMLPQPYFIFDLNHLPLPDGVLRYEWVDDALQTHIMIPPVNANLGFFHDKITVPNADQAASINTTPFYRIRLDFLRDESGHRDLNSQDATPIETVPNNNREAALSTYLLAAGNVDNYNKVWGVGKEIVGHSCSGDICFIWPEEDDEEVKIIHDLWWSLYDSGTQDAVTRPFERLTRHEIKMGYNQYSRP